MLGIEHHIIPHLHAPLAEKLFEPCRAAVTDYRAAHRIDDPIRSVDWTGVFWRRSR